VRRAANTRRKFTQRRHLEQRRLSNSPLEASVSAVIGTRPGIVSRHVLVGDGCPRSAIATRERVFRGPLLKNQYAILP
jgi:hypothetical protein